MRRCFFRLVVLLLFYAPFLAAPSRVRADEPERWVHYYDENRGLWAKKSSATQEVLHLYRYGAHGDQVSYLTDEEIAKFEGKKFLDCVVERKREGESRGFGDSIFRSEVIASDAVRIVEDAGWVKEEYSDGKFLYKKEGSEKILSVPAERKKVLRYSELEGILRSSNLALDEEESEALIAKH